MELEDQVCSLDLAKRLKELGVKQHSYFHYSLPNPEKAKTVEDKYGLEKCKVEITTTHWGTMFDEYAAFTVAELGEMLPGGIVSFKCNQFHFLNKKKEKWWCDFTPGGRPADMQERGLYEGNCFANTEADARAKMLIYLIENKLITP